MLNDKLINSVLEIAEDAGKAILAVYDEPVELTVKADESPLTQADKAAHNLIEQRLKALTPDWTVVSEESEAEVKNQRTQLSVYWLVDPLDGTKEFIKRNGEFTVNIALIVNGESVFGVVGVPVQNKLYWGGKEYGCWFKNTDGVSRLSATKEKGELLRVVGSRSHVNAETAEYLQRLGAHELVSVGSSLKFCLLAEGKADLYPRLGPTCEWDTAAAQAVLEGAGGKVETLEGRPLRYSKPDILNPWFVASI